MVTLASINSKSRRANFNTWIKDLRLNNSTNAILSSLLKARSEALRTQSRVSLCRTGNVYADDPDCNANIFGTTPTNAVRDWTYGWLIYTTTDVDIAYDPASDHQLLEAASTNLSAKSLVVTSNLTAQNFITFNRDGRIAEQDQFSQFVTIEMEGIMDTVLLFPPMEGQSARTLKISQSPTRTAHLNHVIQKSDP